MKSDMITEDFVSFNVAKLLKDKGFDEPCRVFYKDPQAGLYEFKNAPKAYKDKLFEPCFLAPSLYMAMKWLREVHNIDIVIDAAVGMLGVKVYVPLISTYKPRKDAPSKLRQIKRGIYYKDDKGVIPALQHFDSYEEAVEAACLYSLENLI